METRRVTHPHLSGTYTSGLRFGKAFELVTLAGGDFPEVYTEYPDAPGRMRFRGSANEIPSELYCSLRYEIESHCCAHYEWFGLN